MYSKFIPKNIQEKLKAKERALAYKDTITPDQVKIEGATSPSDIQSRTTFVRMCSNKIEGVPNIVIAGGKLNSLDGKQSFREQKTVDLNQVHILGENIAETILLKGADSIIEELKKSNI